MLSGALTTTAVQISGCNQITKVLEEKSEALEIKEKFETLERVRSYFETGEGAALKDISYQEALSETQKVIQLLKNANKEINEAIKAVAELERIGFRMHPFLIRKISSQVSNPVNSFIEKNKELSKYGIAIDKSNIEKAEGIVDLIPKKGSILGEALPSWLTKAKESGKELLRLAKAVEELLGSAQVLNQGVKKLSEEKLSKPTSNPTVTHALAEKMPAEVTRIKKMVKKMEELEERWDKERVLNPPSAWLQLTESCYIGDNIEVLKKAGLYNGDTKKWNEGWDRAAIEYEKLKSVRGYNNRKLAILENGDIGAPVKTIQKLLKKTGLYKGKIDGEYGMKTEEALTNFFRIVEREAEQIDADLDTKIRRESFDYLTKSIETDELGESKLKTKLKKMEALKVAMKIKGILRGESPSKALKRILEEASALNKEGDADRDKKELIDLIRKLEENNASAQMAVLEIEADIKSNFDRDEWEVEKRNLEELLSTVTSPAFIAEEQEKLKRKGLYKGEINGQKNKEYKRARIHQRALSKMKTAITEPDQYDSHGCGSRCEGVGGELWVESPSSFRIGEKNKSFTYLQKALKAANYYKGPINGIYNESTRDAALSYYENQKSESTPKEISLKAIDSPINEKESPDSNSNSTWTILLALLATGVIAKKLSQGLSSESANEKEEKNRKPKPDAPVQKNRTGINSPSSSNPSEFEKWEELSFEEKVRIIQTGYESDVNLMDFMDCAEEIINLPPNSPIKLRIKKSGDSFIQSLVNYKPGDISYVDDALREIVARYPDTNPDNASKKLVLLMEEIKAAKE